MDYGLTYRNIHINFQSAQGAKASARKVTIAGILANAFAKTYALTKAVSVTADILALVPWVLEQHIFVQLGFSVSKVTDKKSS